LLAGDRLRLHHRVQHQPGPGAGRLRMVDGIQVDRRLDHAGQHRRLADRQLFRRLAEIVPRRRAQAIDPVAEIDAGKIARQDLVLGQPQLQPQGDHRLLALAAQAALGLEEGVLGQLLGDGAAALHGAAGLGVDHQGPGHAAEVDADMVAETPVLDGQEGGRHVFGQRLDHDRRFLVGPAPGEGAALIVQQDQRPVGQRLQSARDRQAGPQPDQQDHQGQQRPYQGPEPQPMPDDEGARHRPGGGQPCLHVSRNHQRRASATSAPLKLE
jgi:hypothetical protein